MKKYALLFFAAFGCAFISYAQKPVKTPRASLDPATLKPFPRQSPGTPSAERNFLSAQTDVESMTANPIFLGPAGFKILASDHGLPTMIRGEGGLSARSSNQTDRNYQYLAQLSQTMKIKNPAEEFQTYNVQSDDLGMTHTRMQQYFQGVKVWGGQIVLHERNEKINMLNGRYFQTPAVPTVVPSVTAAGAQLSTQNDLSQKYNLAAFTADKKKLAGGEPFRSELVLYPDADRNLQLAWHVTAYPTVMSRWEYFIGAQSGQIIEKYPSSCNLIGEINAERIKNARYAGKTTPLHASSEFLPPTDGPVTAQAKDLKGVTQTINTYNYQGTYYMLDASRPMFNAQQSQLPDQPIGAILTLDAMNNSPNGQFNYDHIRSSNNSWGASPTGVSAHFNAGKAYDYYRTTFNRNSINGKGGTILSFINVADDDGSGLDNAYWNGEAMFYGNGKDYFSPLAKALDVGGHEMSHGVIQNTANLNYQGESGAMNEGYADIFGSMIKRNNWLIGDDVVNRAYFPTGALRDLSNPHNGGTRVGDGGYQPAKVSEKYTGSQDNGGVHINSGIVNYAYYLFASDASVGKGPAEQVFYRALDKYLVASSQFIDLRASVLQSIADLYPNNANMTGAANNAFNTVGIGSGGSSTAGDTNPIIPTNPGQDWIVYSAPDSSKIYIAALNDLTHPIRISSTPHINKPSIRDDGTELVFVAADNSIRYIRLHWETSPPTVDKEVNFDKDIFSNPNPVWSNAVISKDGDKLAANTIYQDSTIYIYEDSIAHKWTKYKLYSPTTTTKNSKLYNVLFTDAMEWSLAGDYLMYDAFNAFKTGTTDPLDYYDIGLLKAWDNGTKKFGDGTIFKLVTDVPTNVDLNNPVFSKNSPNIVAFDYVNRKDLTDYLVAANLQTGDVDSVLINNTLNYPSFSRKDDKLIFNAISNNAAVIGSIALQTDKIHPTGANPALVLSNAQWGSWFGTGGRGFTSALQEVDTHALKVYPNPFGATLTLDFNTTEKGDGTLELLDMLGAKVWFNQVAVQNGDNRLSIQNAALPAGVYLVKLTLNGKILTSRAVKMN